MSQTSSSCTNQIPKGMVLARIVMGVQDSSREETVGDVVKGYTVSYPNCGRYNFFNLRVKELRTHSTIGAHVLKNSHILFIRIG